MSSLISIECAVECVGRAIFRERWIGSLTEDEDWFYRRYIEGSANPELKNEPASIMPGMITYSATEGGKKCFWPLFEVQSGALRERIELARDKHDRMEDQYAQVDEWIEDYGFDPNAEGLPADEFERAYEASFGKAIDMPEVAEPAAKAAPLNHELATMPSASDASPAKQTSRATDQALVKAEIMKEFPGGVPLDMPTKRVKALLNGLEKLKGISDKTFDRAVQKFTNTA